MAMPDPGLVVNMAPLLVGSSGVRLRKTRAQKCRDENGCFHDVSNFWRHETGPPCQ